MNNEILWKKFLPLALSGRDHPPAAVFKRVPGLLTDTHRGQKWLDIAYLNDRMIRKGLAFLREFSMTFEWDLHAFPRSDRTESLVPDVRHTRFMFPKVFPNSTESRNQGFLTWGFLLIIRLNRIFH